MKGEKILATLKTIKEIGEDGATLLEAFLRAGYGASLRKIEFEKRNIESRKYNERINRELRARHRDLIYGLKKDELIKERVKEKKKYFFLTEKGKEKILELEEGIKNKLPKNNYEPKNSERFSIVVFDVPENERRKRDWIRNVLKNLKFRMVQKSVWIGKVKISKELIDDLFKLKMDEYVEIFEISKAGSLKQVV